MSDTFPIVLGPQGLQPQAPSSLLSQLIAAVKATNPGYTADLPGSLIEDISSTDVAALALCDSALVELVNSLTPYGANQFLLNQTGQMIGVPIGAPSNTSVYVVFLGPPGFVIAKGFTVSDGTHQYIVQDGGIIGTSSQSTGLFAVASVAGTWAVPPNTVNQLITSVPSSISLTVNNPSTGTPGTGQPTVGAYRAQVLEAYGAPASGMPTYLRKLLSVVPGVQPRLISVVQQTGGWEIICGGGDPYQVAYAIFTALFDISTLVGSTLQIVSVSQNNPGVVETNLNHGYTTGQIVEINGVQGMTELNGNSYTATVLGNRIFSIGIDTTGFTPYTSGGVVTPNLRNVVVSINDYPDTYSVPFVNPPQQTVVINAVWNTSLPNFVSPTAVAQAAVPALVAYVNGVTVGQPMNLFELQATFRQAVADIIPTPFLTRLIFSVTISGVSVSPISGTGIIEGDPESFFEASTATVTVTQG